MKAKTQCSFLSKDMACAGKIPDYYSGTPLYIEGIVRKNEKNQYRIDISYIKEKPWDITSTVTYLTNICSSLGIGSAMSLAEIYGDHLFELVKEENVAELISEKVSSISLSQAATLCEMIAETCLQREIYSLIARIAAFGLTL